MKEYRPGKVLGLCLLFAAALCFGAATGCGSEVGNDGLYDTTTDNAADWPADTSSDTPLPDTLPPDVVTDSTPDGTGDDCEDRAEWIYIIDRGKVLIRFMPDVMSLTEIGTVNCPVGAGVTPFSMSVDRDAVAWVLHTSLLGLGGGELFKVSTLDASCEATTFTPAQEGFQVFGMGFVSDAPGIEDETLYIAGGATLSIGTGPSQLGYINMDTMVVTRQGEVPNWPELTGNGRAELWGFFPESTPPTVSMIDKWTGNVSNTYNLPELDTGRTEAWAFAFWGGDFYIFHKTMADVSTNIWKLETDDGTVTNVMPNIGYAIVGAGVSTCAPVMII